MDYTRPVLRLADENASVASCTPCRPRRDDVYVSWDYTQVTPWFGLCNTVAPGLVGNPPVLRTVRVASGTTIAADNAWRFDDAFGQVGGQVGNALGHVGDAFAGTGGRFVQIDSSLL